MEKKILYIPNTDYIDGIPEIVFVPVDEFMVGVVSALAVMWSGLPLMLAPVGAGGMVYVYRKFKKKYTKNFYLTITYRAGLKKPEGVPPVTVTEFME